MTLLCTMPDCQTTAGCQCSFLTKWERVIKMDLPQSSAPNILADTRCPTCNLGWGFNPPVKVHGSDAYRCIECKAVYTGNMMQADNNATDVLRLHNEKCDAIERAMLAEIARDKFRAALERICFDESVTPFAANPSLWPTTIASDALEATPRDLAKKQAGGEVP